MITDRKCFLKYKKLRNPPTHTHRKRLTTCARMWTETPPFTGPWTSKQHSGTSHWDSTHSKCPASQQWNGQLKTERKYKKKYNIVSLVAVHSFTILANGTRRRKTMHGNSLRVGSVRWPVCSTHASGQRKVCCSESGHVNKERGGKLFSLVQTQTRPLAFLGRQVFKSRVMPTGMSSFHAEETQHVGSATVLLLSRVSQNKCLQRQKPLQQAPLRW